MSDCGCKKAKDQAKLMSWLGLLSHKFDDIGVFTYWLQNDSDSVSPSNYCSIVVQRNVKVCIICFFVSNSGLVSIELSTMLSGS